MAPTSDTFNFRVTLLKLSKILTVKNVKEMSILCAEFSQDIRERITTGKELFDALQRHDLLSEGNLSYLIGLLDDISLVEASQLLKDYQRLQYEGTSLCISSILFCL